MPTAPAQTAQTVTAFIAFGSNLGDREQTIEAARSLLANASGVRTVRCSALIETDPVGPAGQGPYLNGVTEIQTTLAPRALLDLLLSIEQSLGRIRTETDQRWGPRTIDLDLLLYADRISDEPGLTLPHPRLHERRFVLAPLAQIAPRAMHPVRHQTAAQMLAALDRETPVVSDRT